jgi:hypothetical protein
VNVTLTANGYQGIKGDTTETTEHGARVTINRKGIDLAPRTIFFTWDAIKGGKIETPKPVVPAHNLTPEGAYNIKAKVERVGNATYFETGSVNGSIAGAKSHILSYQIKAWDNEDGTQGDAGIWIFPTCGATRSAKTGGHYQNHIRLADTITCAKCAKRA